jgi:bifunctional UDP-N-acetylglucosamine pyrophosphorylase/glucosamine-1-phosphate N-acetyltransferase
MSTTSKPSGKLTSADASAVAIILAAGKGTRLKSDLAKVLHRAAGLPLISHVLRSCEGLGLGSSIVVVGYQAGEVRAVADAHGARAVIQEPLGGTGHAVAAAREPAGSARFALVLPGDAPLVTTDTLRPLLDAHLHNDAAATILTARLDTPSGYGRILRRPDGYVAAIVEEKSATPDELAFREVNSGIYCFTLEKLWPCLDELQPENAHRELYLTDAIALLNQQSLRVAAVAGPPEEILGCNTRAELADADRILRRRKIAVLMDSGVTIYLPETVAVDVDVQAGQDTIIEPHAMLLGSTIVGARCRIATGCILEDATLGDDIVLKPYTLIYSSRLETAAAAGPFSHLRDEAHLDAEARIGNFVEVKKSQIGSGVKAMHLSYLGDASIGAKTNIGAGTITCNYDGEKKNRTVIGERVFVGSGTELIAPVTVGSDSYIAAGSTITQDVPENSLAIARARQEVKLGWAADRRSASGKSVITKTGVLASASPASGSTQTKPRIKAKRPSATPKRRQKPQNP